MADTTTTTYGLVKPEVGASEDTWGTKSNTNLDTIDNLLDGTTAIAPNLSTLKIGGTAVTADAAELNKMDGLTASTTELNKMDGVTASTAEINYIDGVTSNIQTQLGTKMPIAGGTFTGNITRGGTVISDGAISDTGNFTVDVAGVIILDADNTGNIRFHDGGTEYGRVYSPSSSNMAFFSAVSNADMLFQGNDGGSTVTALTLDMSAAGAATFNNNVTAYSDERLKENIVTVPDALEKVTAMRGVHYNRIDTGKAHTGVVAQEIQEIAPELVLTADDEIGTLSVDYGNITGYLIEAIKELKAEIEELKGK